MLYHRIIVSSLERISIFLLSNNISNNRIYNIHKAEIDCLVITQIYDNTVHY